MKKVISIGEALIDFIPNQKGCELKDVIGFERVAGGAPANVSAVVAKLGGKSNFISKLGRDAFGDHIIEVLKEANVRMKIVYFDLFPVRFLKSVISKTFLERGFDHSHPFIYKQIFINT